MILKLFFFFRSSLAYTQSPFIDEYVLNDFAVVIYTPILYEQRSRWFDDTYDRVSSSSILTQIENYRKHRNLVLRKRM